MQVVLGSYPVDIFTAHYRVSGEFRPRGSPFVFLNDASNQTLVVHEASVVPLRPGVELEPLFAPALYVPKSDPQVLVLGNLKLEDVKPLPKKAALVCLTDLYVIRGNFHMGMDTRVEDVFAVQQGPFFFASDLQITSLYVEATGVRASAELAFVHKNAVRAFFVPDKEEA